MDTNLLRYWLGLPPGEWPPDPKALLGHGAGVQERALALMERLRPHQLRHPELVTEGMNRLAQALIAAEQSSHTTILEAEAVVLSKPVEAVPTPVLSTPPTAIPKPKSKRRQVSPPVTVPDVSPVRALPAIRDRRSSYRKLSQLRACLQSWVRLGPFLGVPSQDLTTSSDILHFIEAIVQCQKASLAIETWPAQSGTRCLEVVHSNGSLSFFRNLQPMQRERFAADWARANAQLQNELRSLRLSLSQSKPRPTWSRRCSGVRKWAQSHPEWLLAAVILISVTGALIRHLVHSTA